MRLPTVSDRVILSEGRDGVSTLLAQLDELWSATDAPVTARSPWIDTWITTYTSWDPWLVAVRDPSGQRLAGAALLASRTRFGVTDIVAVGHGPSDYQRLPARDEAAAGALARAVADALRHRRGPWRLDLQQLPAGDPVASRLADALACAEVVPGDAAPGTVFDAGRDVNSYTSRNLRSQVRRKRQRLEEAAGAVEVRFTRDASEIASVQHEIEAIRVERDRQVGRLGDVDTREGSAFWWASIPRMAEAGELEVATLVAGGEIAAYVVALLDGRVYRSWDPRMNPKWAEYSPGLILDLAVLERILAEERFDSFDRMRGEEAYKLRTANASLAADRLVAWSSPTLRRFDRTVAEVKHRVRRSDRLKRTTRVARRVVRGGISRVRRRELAPDV